MSLATAVMAGALRTETEFARELPMEPILYGLIAFVVFLVLGAVVMSYRDVANRHKAKADAYAARHGGAGSAGH